MQATLPEPPTLLDPLESTVRFTPGTSICGTVRTGFDIWSQHRHDGWHADREKVRAALEAAFVPFSRLRAFTLCGRGGWVLRRRDRPHEYAVVPQYCHDRFCRPCAQQRSWIIRKNLSAHLPDHPCRFVTLTLRSGAEPLTELLDKLRDSFTALRKQPFWTARVWGGVAFIEVKWSERAQRWHPHLHLITHGKFIPAGYLSKLWQEITGTSFIVDVRLIRSQKEVLNYVAKYATKGLDDNTLDDPDRLVECVQAMRGRKLCGAFGDWAHLRLLQPDGEGDWSLLCDLRDLAGLCIRGDPDCRLVEQAILSDAHRPIEMRYTVHPPPDFYAVTIGFTDADIAAFYERYPKSQQMPY